ncbi:MAG: AAA family ATPase [Selenomonadales bacterium]|nr:AAA family ATPase [Selenomonadales bacterium]
MTNPFSPNHYIATDNQSKTISLFQFIRELNILKQKAIINYSDYPWAKTLSSFPKDPDNISIFYRDRVDSEPPATEDTILLVVHKPEFEKCPPPDELLTDWLTPDWDDFRKKVSFIKSRKKEDPSAENEPIIEYFTDDSRRVITYNTWLEKRSVWAAHQELLRQTRNLFSDLYRLYFELQRDSETLELIVANGILLDKTNPSAKHPLLTKRVKLNYDPHANTIYIEETDSSPELYSIPFQTIDDINLSAINQLQSNLQANDFHPLDRNDTPDFLKILVHQLSSNSLFSDNGIPNNWQASARFLLYTDPIYIMRKRLDGTLKAIEQIIETIQETGYIPNPIIDIVGGGKAAPPDEPKPTSLEEQLAAVGGESIDVLLSKEANKEQLEIAKRIENYNAVLVQGPPGTGKTHTIANLMGHFLAQGKTVLVTSHTSKALHVLKDKVAPGLQSLCVSVLEDSNIDMERSIDGITEFMSRTTSYEIKTEMEQLALERRQVIANLADVRRNIFHILNQEQECIVYNGESLSPSAAAAFVLEHSETLSYIPGKVRLDTPLPLSLEDLSALYCSNEHLSADDETELHKNLPNPEDILTPEYFVQIETNIQTAKQQLDILNSTAQWSFMNDPISHSITFSKDNRSFSIPIPDMNAVSQLKETIGSLSRFEPWMKAAAADGKNGGVFRKRWHLLIEQLLTTCVCAENVLDERFGHNIAFPQGVDMSTLINPLETLQSHFEQNGLLSKFKLMLIKNRCPALKTLLVDGHPIQSAKECELVLHVIELDKNRSQCSVYWDELLSPHGVAHFFNLDQQCQERIAKNWIPAIQKYLDWYQDIYTPLSTQLQAIGIPANILFDDDPSDSDLAATEKRLAVTLNELPAICDICDHIVNINRLEDRLTETASILKKDGRSESHTCRQILKAIESDDTEAYAEAYIELTHMYQKYGFQRQRHEMLSKIESVAPQWASAIRNREDIHGSRKVPDTIEDAWKWKQLSGFIDKLMQAPFNELQDKGITLSKAYRRITAQYAEKNAWYHLLCNTEGNYDIRQALNGWKLTIKKIGKGTGKNAPKLKAEARNLMSICQSAVPCWIMPMNRALESLIPGKNNFDIIIIDEASQSDISSLAILYMGKKLVIVGDDKQVSPMAVGVDIDKMNALQQLYIQGKIPNSHLYDGKTSIYDIAKTTFPP